MSMAYLTARRSKDPSTQCGAIIVNTPQGRVLGTGYNGMPNGCKYSFPWESDGDFLNSKYAYVVHAEVNAIMNAKTDLTGTIMYCTLFPCNECAKVIVQAGITNVYYADDKYHDKDFSEAARSIFNSASVSYVKYSGDLVFPKQVSK